MATKTELAFLSILQLMEDPEALGRWFTASSWNAWKVVLKATFALPLTCEERKTFSKHTGRQSSPKSVRELWMVIGRRGGKSRVAALIAVYLAFFVDWSRVLAMGEKGYIMLIYPDRRQARVTMGYITAFIDSVSMLAAMVERQTKESIDLDNGIVIEVTTCNFRTVRGYTVVAAICDEIAFWRSEDSANPDFEILNSLRPAMATVSGSLLIAISSPYARRGALWEAHRKYFGKDEDSMLVWKASTRAMNPTVPERVIKEAYELDPAVAAAEYGAEFRRDIESFISREAVEAAVVPERRELPYLSRFKYVAFVDPSGGRCDSMTLAIAHREGDTSVLDVIRERRPPFSPQQVVEEFAELLKGYRITTIHGDRYGGEWPREQFRKRGVDYQVSGKVRSDLYRDLLPAINSGQAELLDNPRLINQLCGLERRTSRSGKDSIDHSPGTHDDLANAVAGALLAPKRSVIQIFV